MEQRAVEYPADGAWVARGARRSTGESGPRRAALPRCPPRGGGTATRTRSIARSSATRSSRGRIVASRGPGRPADLDLDLPVDPSGVDREAHLGEQAPSTVLGVSHEARYPPLRVAEERGLDVLEGGGDLQVAAHEHEGSWRRPQGPSSRSKGDPRQATIVHRPAMLHAWMDTREVSWS